MTGPVITGISYGYTTCSKKLDISVIRYPHRKYPMNVKIAFPTLIFDAQRDPTQTKMQNAKKMKNLVQ